MTDPALAPGFTQADRLRSESTDQMVKSEHAASSPRGPSVDTKPASSKSSPTPLPSTEPADPGATPATSGHPTKRKGMASAVKRGPRGRKPKSGVTKRPKRGKSGSAAAGAGEASEEESDSGPYCVCRGPDDHRWMICCEKCEDWFHGECIKMNKEIGENLIEKFVCPNCATDTSSTIYKKTCGLGACRKAARLASSPPSRFCSDEHAHTWWERMIGRLPKARAKLRLHDQLSQDEFMALLNSDLGTVDEAGTWHLARSPFSGGPSHNEDVDKDEAFIDSVLSDEERGHIDDAAKARSALAEETHLCQKMFTLVEFAQERRRVAIRAGHFGEDLCGYDTRLDGVLARDVFSAFVKSPEGEEIFTRAKLGDPLGEDDAVRGICDRKRCKTHSGWQKMLSTGIKHRIRDMAIEVAQAEEEEKTIREAAGERWKRKQAENNWVEASGR